MGRGHVLRQHCRQNHTRHRVTVSRQSFGEQCPPGLHPTGNGSFRDIELPGRLLAGLAFQVTQDDDGTILFRQSTQFLVQKGQEIV